MVKVFPTGDVRVSVNGRIWTLNPLCVVPAPDENPPPASGKSLTHFLYSIYHTLLFYFSFQAEDDLPVPEDMDVQLKLLSLLENPAVIVAAAASGDVSTMRDFLSKHPKEVSPYIEGGSVLKLSS